MWRVEGGRGRQRGQRQRQLERGGMRRGFEVKGGREHPGVVLLGLQTAQPQENPPSRQSLSHVVL